MESEQEMLSNVVKGLHQRLRIKLKEANGDFEKVWKDHCADKEILQDYATAMHSLATEQWAKNSPGGRADWCVKTCQEYFKGGGLVTALEKQKRRFKKEMATPCCCCLNVCYDKDSVVEGKLNLLDVGSCYDPFGGHPEFSSVAIDLHPAIESVYNCDFLNLEVVTNHTSLGIKQDGSITCICSCERKNPVTSNDEEKKHDNQDNNTTDSITKERSPSITKLFPYSQGCCNIKRFLAGPVVSELPGSYFHAVVFSLLLSYFPTPAQRWTCCVKAHQLLAVNGILIIITPDSSHQNRNVAMMKSWKAAIESIGFVRWRYLKDMHVHCMVFRKVSPCHHSCSRTCSCKISINVNPNMLYMRQDFHDDKGNKNDYDKDDKNDSLASGGSCDTMDNEDYQGRQKKRKIEHSS